MTDKKKHRVIEGLEDAIDYARQNKINRVVQGVADMDPKDKRIKLLENQLQEAPADRIPLSVLKEIIDVCETYNIRAMDPNLGRAIITLIKSRMHWK